MNIDIILLEKIHNLGQLGDKISVKPGYWRNYLLPQGKAVLATAQNIAQVEERRVELEKTMTEKLALANARADKLNDVTITISAKAAEEGKLYGSLAVKDLADAILQATGVTIEKGEIDLSNGPIRSVGEHNIEIRLHPEIVASIKVNVVAESA